MCNWVCVRWVNNLRIANIVGRVTYIITEALAVHHTKERQIWMKFLSDVLDPDVVGKGVNIS